MIIRGTEWINGVESWCGLPGAFVSFVREPTAEHALDKIVICTLGVIADTSADLRTRFDHMSDAVSVN